MDEKREKFVNNEIKTLKKLRGKNNVIQIIDAFKNANYYYIFFEICNGGDLKMLKLAKGRLEERLIKKILF